MRSECVFERAFGAKAHAVCGDVFGVTALIRCDFEFRLRWIITKPARFGTDVDSGIWYWLSGIGIGDDEANFEVGATDPFNGLAKRKKHYQTDNENSGSSETTVVCMRYVFA